MVAHPAAMTEQIVSVQDLTKVYGQTRALDGVTLQIHAGEIFGVLGPNGAGKTTLLETLVGLRRPTGGTVRTLGYDPIAQRAELVKRIGVQPQQASLFPNLSVIETTRLFASLHANPLPAEEILRTVGLESKARDLVKRLSGGQQQRLLIGVALVANPMLLLLDEPTGSLDPQARRQLWDVIRQQRERGKTVLLTTHSMEEAQSLCDRVAIIDHGRIVALGTPTGLIQRYFPERNVVFEADTAPPADLLRALPGVSDVYEQRRVEGVHVRIRTRSPEDTLRHLLANSSPMHLRNIRMEQATLEDVFLAITGRSIRDDS